MTGARLRVVPGVFAMSVLAMLFALLALCFPAPASAASPGPSSPAASTPAATGPTVIPDIPYGSPDEPALVLDAYPAADAAPAPVVIAIHGGGWRGGDKKTFAPLARGLSTAGFVVFNINYSLDTSLGPAYPREVNDVTKALDWVLEHAPEYGGDPDRIGVLGGSAGAHLAAMLGVTANTPESQPVKAVVTLSGPFDLLPLREVIRLLEEDPPTECADRSTCFSPTATEAEGLIALLGCDPQECPDDVMIAASPVTYVTQYSPPFYIANSSAETVPADQSTLMADKLRAVGVPVEVQIIPGAAHSIQFLPKVAQPAVAFFQEYLAEGRPAFTPTPTASATAPPTSIVLPPVDDDNGNGRLWRWLVLGVAIVALVIGVAVRRTREPRS